MPHTLVSEIREHHRCARIEAAGEPRPRVYRRDMVPGPDHGRQALPHVEQSAGGAGASERIRAKGSRNKTPSRVPGGPVALRAARHRQRHWPRSSPDERTGSPSPSSTRRLFPATRTRLPGPGRSGPRAGPGTRLRRLVIRIPGSRKVNRGMAIRFTRGAIREARPNRSSSRGSSPRATAHWALPHRLRGLPVPSLCPRAKKRAATAPKDSQKP